MHDVTIKLTDHPGTLARMGEALASHNISIEGGGIWTLEKDGTAVGHFLFNNGNAAKAALQEVGIEVGPVRDVLAQRLEQEVPGQLGKICREMAEAGVNIETLYSDHDNRLILVVDDSAKAKSVSSRWA